MVITQLFDAATSTFTYLIFDEENKEAVIIDPVLEQFERDVEQIEQGGLKLTYILETHVHADHITGASLLRKKFDALILTGSQTKLKCADILAEHRERYMFGSYSFEVRHTPGHTKGCVSYVFTNEEQTYVFTGDTLFIRGCGRTDFQGGSSDTLYASVHEQLYSLPSDTIVYPGHDYNGRFSTTIADEKKHNPRLNTDIDKDGFVEIMNNLKLAYPKRIDVSLPANRCCGDVPTQSHFTDVHVDNVANGNFIIIDVREPHECSGTLGQIPGSINLPLGSLAISMRDHEREHKYLMVCRSGKRSVRACQLLSDLGFSNLYNLKGGMTAWNQSQKTERPSC